MIESKYKIPESIKLKTVKNEDLRKFCVMPLKAVLNKNITGENLRVLGVLASYANKGGFSFVSCETMAKDLKCSYQNVHKHLSKLEKQGIIETYRNYFPKLKGNTRRIIYDEKIKREDLSEHDLKNSEISEILKANQVINKLNENDSQSQEDVQSANHIIDEVASLFMSITKESQLIEIEKLLAQGLSVSEIKTRMALA